ncbi:arylsulfatase F [Monodelphis domestica]|uniref:arylsulfatase F n=1 Tax=Monodelphis domestica TaxID=13616 RepID=UPI0024E26F00|nr:arylsulfatase F [Monodelphis domestica]XP_007501043.2 arylsulfatase F [Monodelphis domestica]XP_016280291.2 arylsulfatase F [Monodelphis domestica]XP_016280292.2 arylsulfatase F [Monodelphis domestica]
MMEHWSSLIILSLVGVLLQVCELTSVPDSRPNVLLIMADDLGIGDLGCFGNVTLRTPNIDRLCKEGVKLTQHISAEALCTPSRSAFLTGRYPVRTGMVSREVYRRHYVFNSLGVKGGLPLNETTFAATLKKQGYSTALIGKWHQGLNCKYRNDYCHHPNHYGFDYFYGMPHTLTGSCWPDPSLPTELAIESKLWFCMELIIIAVLTLTVGKLIRLFSIPWWIIIGIILFGFYMAFSWFSSLQISIYWDCILMRQQEITEQPMKAERSGSIMLKEAVSFIERNKDRPFLLFYSFLHVHIPLPTTNEFFGRSKHSLYGDNVEEMDFFVGKLLDALDAKDLKNNTIVYFASDHGGHLEIMKGNIHLGGFNGIYRGGKGMAGWEGGIRVPGIVRWPGILPAGKVIEEPTSLMDIFPTLTALVGATLPQDRVIDGRDLMPLLKGEVEHSEHEFMYHYCGVFLHAVRWHPRNSSTVWKVHYMTPVFNPEGAIGCFDILYCPCTGENVIHHDPPLLFELSRDPSESNPLSPADEPQYNSVIRIVANAVEQHQKTIKIVPEQLTLYNDNIVGLRPCCGVFPFCFCDKETENSTIKL